MTTITLEAANIIIAAAFRHAQEQGLQPLTVAVLDAGGHMIALQRQNGASTLRPRIACGKAGGALDRPTFVAALGSISDHHGIVPAAGGVIVTEGDGGIMGAVGVTGDTSDTSDHDEACAIAGTVAAGLNVQR